MMTSIPVAELNELFADEEMILPRCHAEPIDFRERQQILNEIKARGWESTVDHEKKELPAAEELFCDESFPIINVWPVQNVQVNIFHWDPAAFEFDFDVREMQTQPDLDAVCEFVRMVGGVVQRPVELRWEGSDIAFYTYNPSTNEFVK